MLLFVIPIGFLIGFLLIERLQRSPQIQYVDLLDFLGFYIVSQGNRGRRAMALQIWNGPAFSSFEGAPLA